MRSTVFRRLATTTAVLGAALALTAPMASAAQPAPLVPGELYKVQLNLLRCVNISESGEDELYLKLDGGVVVPTSTCAERGTVDYSAIDPERFIFEGGTPLNVELWEQDPDYIDPDDKLGVFELNDARVNATNIARVVKNGDYSYTLTYTVLPL
ncbi:hypothetical protein GT204_33195 [Streptomyces sp. SID4919]|uniref:Lipoprotein n=1 Tax=Streptomyces uncialis TaxID=1048205 RepID=A0A1Q4UZB0_9ACTN|nr:MULTISPECIES: hypothetical protein [Streptomyces]MCX4663696.1 hypothetical protein [Streptomyces uncialis]MYY13593.1 hypothetical protein [Streptomyces sp. SID4919]OKH90915.1 hypothetical protein AB852_30775 [Streptomyces uncialis]WST70596.1 hypothetical protein OG268_26030 [Streptomyces uncialis]WTE10728.1 hypothetical protein OG924_10785 [Streptomyces uncialis]